MNWETYIAFGDSITLGARTYLGYPEYTGKLLEHATKKSWNVISHAENGFTAANLLRSIDRNLQNLKESTSSVSTLLIGTNDVKLKTDEDDFETAYSLLLLKIKLISRTSNIKVFEIPDFPPGVMYPYTFSMNESVPSYNKIINKIASEQGVKCYPLNLTDADLFDGVHLNRQGCIRMADYFAKLILQDRGM
jgi:lysophospholipase L1-like esterase